MKSLLSSVILACCATGAAAQSIAASSQLRPIAYTGNRVTVQPSGNDVQSGTSSVSMPRLMQVSSRRAEPTREERKVDKRARKAEKRAIKLEKRARKDQERARRERARARELR